MCVVFTFVDDFFSTGSLQHATEAQEHVHAAIRGTLGYDGLSVKKNVFAQTAENRRARPTDTTLLAIPLVAGHHVLTSIARDAPVS